MLRTPKRNFYSLVRQPAQQSFEPRKTDPPVGEFVNGFAGYTVNQIREYVSAHEAQIEQQSSNLEAGQFAILDERSRLDNTVVLWMQLDSNLTQRRQADDTGDTVDEAGQDEWHSWRVKFEDSLQIATDLSMVMDSWPAYCRTDLVGEDGVFDVKRAYQDFCNGY